MFAMRELVAILADAVAEAWQAADLGGRLSVWWRVVTHEEVRDARA